MAAFGVAQHSGTLVDAAPRLMAATNPGDLAQVSASVDEARENLEANLAVLLGGESFDRRQRPGRRISPNCPGVLQRQDGKQEAHEVGRSERIRESVDMLIVNINAIRDDMTRLYELKRPQGRPAEGARRRCGRRWTRSWSRSSTISSSTP